MIIPVTILAKAAISVIVSSSIRVTGLLCTLKSKRASSTRTSFFAP
jgi:hypothetical protein